MKLTPAQLAFGTALALMLPDGLQLEPVEDEHGELTGWQVALTVPVGPVADHPAILRPARP